jgi:hypothetical protein
LNQPQNKRRAGQENDGIGNSGDEGCGQTWRDGECR